MLRRLSPRKDELPFASAPRSPSFNYNGPASMSTRKAVLATVVAIVVLSCAAFSLSAPTSDSNTTQTGDAAGAGREGDVPVIVMSTGAWRALRDGPCCCSGRPHT